MQYVLLTVTDKDGFTTGIDWLVNTKEPKETFVLKYEGEVIHQLIFKEEEGNIFYALISLYDPEIIKPLNVFNKERKERLNKDK
nr:MAG TPA: hypothetical protein [Caudoviricetes sp.]